MAEVSSQTKVVVSSTDRPTAHRDGDEIVVRVGGTDEVEVWVEATDAERWLGDCRASVRRALGKTPSQQAAERQA